MHSRNFMTNPPTLLYINHILSGKKVKFTLLYEAYTLNQIELRQCKKWTSRKQKKVEGKNLNLFKKYLKESHIYEPN